MFDLLLSDPLPAVFVGWAKATRRSAAFVATATRVPVDDCAGLVWVDKASATPSWPREADIVVEREFRTSWVHQGYLEPQSCSAMFDPLGNVTVYASTQALFHTRRQVAHVLGLG